MLAGACASAPEPNDEDVWHESSLRPSRVPPQTQGERKLLTRLSDMPTNEPVRIGGQVFVAGEPYAAASGRTCRSVTVRAPDGSKGADVKLACHGRAGGWTFVPDVFAEAAQQRKVSQKGEP
jgi:hypothetical protein